MTPPVPASANPTAQDNLTVALNMARTRLNEQLATIQSVGGKILGTQEAFSQQISNNGWRNLMDFLGNLGYQLFTNQFVVIGFPVAASQDPAVQCWLSWSGCSDGVNVLTTPALPADFVSPLQLWERYTGQNMPFPTDPMEKIVGRLPSIPRSTWMGMWQWRTDAIFLPGSLQVEDLMIQYIRYLPDFVDGSPIPNVPWYQQTLPLTRGADALAWYICAETEAARKNDWAAQFRELGEDAARRIFNRDVRANQRVNLRRQSRSGRLEGNIGYNYGY